MPACHPLDKIPDTVSMAKLLVCADESWKFQREVPTNRYSFDMIGPARGLFMLLVELLVCRTWYQLAAFMDTFAPDLTGSAS